MDLETIRQEARAVAEELITTAQMKPGQILVVGCSSSEIHNSKLGTDSSQEIGQAVFEALRHEFTCRLGHVLRLRLPSTAFHDNGQIDAVAAGAFAQTLNQY